MSPALIFLLLIYLPLLILCLIFIYSAIKRKNRTKFLLLSIALGFCIYRISLGIKDEITFQKIINKEEKLHYNNYNTGDTAMLEGLFLYRLYDDKATEDSNLIYEKQEAERTGRSFFSISVLPAGAKYAAMKIIETDLVARDSLSRYMDYYQQLKDSSTFKFAIKAIQQYEDGISWRLIEVIRIDTVKGKPKYWH